MVLIALTNGVVGAEKFLFCIIIMPNGTSLPSMTFDAKMVVALARELTLPCPTLQQSLCQCDTCRNVVFDHFLYGQILICFDILLKIRIPPDLLCRDSIAANKKT